MPVCTEAERNLIEALVGHTSFGRSDRGFDNREQVEMNHKMNKAFREAEAEVLKERMPPERFEQMVRSRIDLRRAEAREQLLAQESYKLGFEDRDRWRTLYDNIEAEAKKRMEKGT